MRRMRNAAIWTLAILVLLALAVVAAGQLGALQGRRPSDLGVRDGRLKPPSHTPNSVSSQALMYPDHPMRAYAAIEPLPLRGDAHASIAALRSQIEAMRGARIVDRRDDYLRAEFSTPLLGFVDDVEFWAGAGAIHLRSASRLGRKDFGVNRERIERIRSRWNAGAAPG